MSILSERLTQLRKERELTLEMLVADLSAMFPNITINKSQLSRWENGQNEPTLCNAKYLSQYYNVSLDYLIGLTDVRTPSRLLARKMGSYIQAISSIGEGGGDPT